MNQSTVQATTSLKVEHVIGYAYPSSPLASQLGFSKSGCFTVEVGGKATPAGTFCEAKAVAQRLGTVPGRWSMDHPSNSHMSHSGLKAGHQSQSSVSA